MIMKLCEKKNTDKFKGKSGIYFLIYHDEIIYVGQSSNLGKRLRRHYRYESGIKEAYNKIEKEGELFFDARMKAIRMYQFIGEHLEEVYFRIEEVPINMLDEKEQRYIEKYLPKYNYSGIDVPYRGVKRKSKGE